MKARKTREGLEHYYHMPNLQEWRPNKGKLLDTAYKVLPIVILHRFEKYAAEIIDQFDFIKGEFTSDHIYIKFYEYDKELHMIFIGF